MQLDPMNAVPSHTDTPSAVSAGETSAQRAPLKVRVEYSHIEDFLVDYTSNHTIGGMFIKTDRPLGVGTCFLLRMQLPGGGRAIEAEAEVRWTLPVDVAAPMTPGMGVRFARLNTADRAVVERMLDKWR